MVNSQNVIRMAIWGAHRVKIPCNSKRLFKLPRYCEKQSTMAFWGAYRVKIPCNSKRLFQLPRSRVCHRFEGGRYPQVLISEPNKDMCPRCNKGEVGFLTSSGLYMYIVQCTFYYCQCSHWNWASLSIKSVYKKKQTFNLGVLNPNPDCFLNPSLIE